jgi:hypothetical protein
MEVINPAWELLDSIETGNEIHARMAFRWNQTKDETA